MSQIAALAARSRVHPQSSVALIFKTFSSKDEIPSFAAACNFPQGFSYLPNTSGEFK